MGPELAPPASFSLPCIAPDLRVPPFSSTTSQRHACATANSVHREELCSAPAWHGATSASSELQLQSLAQSLE